MAGNFGARQSRPKGTATSGFISRQESFPPNDAGDEMFHQWGISGRETQFHQPLLQAIKPARKPVNWRTIVNRFMQWPSVDCSSVRQSGPSWVRLCRACETSTLRSEWRSCSWSTTLTMTWLEWLLQKLCDKIPLSKLCRNCRTFREVLWGRIERKTCRCVIEIIISPDELFCHHRSNTNID